jgi:hypothetical protein
LSPCALSPWHICHAKGKEPPSAHCRPIMNSWAFCDWFNAHTPVNLPFEQAHAKRARTLDKMRIVADADVKPVPAHTTLEAGKSATVVALQLLKRNRNTRYDARKGQRLPPSVMIAKFAGETSNCLAGNRPSWIRARVLALPSPSFRAAAAALIVRAGEGSVARIARPHLAGRSSSPRTGPCG